MGKKEDQKFKGTMKALKVSTESETKQIFSNRDGCGIRLTDRVAGAKSRQLSCWQILPPWHSSPGTMSVEHGFK